jgi:hypothetical protein
MIQPTLQAETLPRSTGFASPFVTLPVVRALKLWWATTASLPRRRASRERHAALDREISIRQHRRNNCQIVTKNSSKNCSALAMIWKVSGWFEIARFDSNNCKGYGFAPLSEHGKRAAGH